MSIRHCEEQSSNDDVKVQRNPIIKMGKCENEISTNCDHLINCSIDCLEI